MVWYSHLFQNFPQFIVIHTVKGFGIVNKAEIDVFRELFCFFDDPMDVDNLITGSSAFSETSLSIWKFTVYILLKPGLENFEHYFTSMWDLQPCGHCWVFQICWHIECNIFTASSFRIWNNSTGILPPPLALFIVMLSKAHLTSHSRRSGSLEGHYQNSQGSDSHDLVTSRTSHEQIPLHWRFRLQHDFWEDPNVQAISTPFF